MNIVKPIRATRTYTQRLAGPPDAVFPLLCPVREADWIDGWDAPLVVSNSGIAEADCVFTTRSTPVDAIWYITRYEPGNGFVEMLKITPDVTACRLTIQLRPLAAGSEADVTYTHTSLGPQGDAFVASFTEDHYRRFMQQREAQPTIISPTARRFERPPAEGQAIAGALCLVPLGRLPYRGQGSLIQD